MNLKTTVAALVSIPLILSALAVAPLQGESDDNVIKTPVPAIYEMFDTGTDWQDRGPIGGVVWSTWEDIQPSPGVLSLGKIEAKLAAAAKMTVTLSSGEVVSKPMVIQIFPYLSSTTTSGWTADGWDGTPQWVYQRVGGRPTENGRMVGHRLTHYGQVAVVPAYDSWTWRSEFSKMIVLLGAAYDDDPRVAGVVIATGIDGETQPIKTMGGVNWTTVMNEQAAGNEYRFGQWVYECIDNYAAAFPNTPLWLDNAAGGSGTRKATTRYCEGAGIGIQVSAMVPDIDSWRGYGEWWGLMDGPRLYSDTIPIALETRIGYGSNETRRWTLLAGLSQHPGVMMVHPDYVAAVDPAFVTWVAAHLGGIDNPRVSAWTVLRDAEYPITMWGTDGAGGCPGDWVYGLERVAGASEIVGHDDLPAGDARSRQARRIDTATFRVTKPMGDGPWALSLQYVSESDNTMSVTWQGHKVYLIGRGEPHWETSTVALYDWTPDMPITINSEDGIGEIIHMLEVLAVGAPATPTQTATVSPSPSPSGTPEPSPTATNTPTCTRTATAVTTATATPTVKPCLDYIDIPWGDRVNILESYRAHVGDELDPIDWASEPTYLIGAGIEHLGALQTNPYVVGRYLCRAFADSIVVIDTTLDGGDTCRTWNIVEYDGTQRNR